MATRINKYLSEVGYCSRRAADRLIEEKKVTINGKIPEIGSIMFFGGIFIYVVFSSLTKAPLEASGDPFNTESKKFVYPH